MFFKKTVVLTGKGNLNEKAVLTIEKVEEGYAGSLKLYHFSDEPNGILSLGILPEQGKVHKCGLTKKSAMNYSFLLQEELPLQTFSCALIQLSQGKALPLLIGTHNQANAETLEERLAFSAGLLHENPNMQRAQEVLDGCNIQLENAQEIEKEIDQAMQAEDTPSPCLACPYRKCFFDSDALAPPELKQEQQAKSTQQQAQIKPVQKQSQVLVSNAQNASPKQGKPSQAQAQTTMATSPVVQMRPSTSTEQPEQQKDETFYAQIKAELAELFASYPRETVLERIVPDSKWVRVNLDNEDEHYVVGTIDEDGKLKYICYGIPGIFSGKPPKQIERYAQWLPLDASKPNDYGYWMTYQEASSGESIRIVI